MLGLIGKDSDETVWTMMAQLAAEYSQTAECALHQAPSPSVPGIESRP